MVRILLTTPHETPGQREFFAILLYVLRKSIWKYDLKYILLQKGALLWIMSQKVCPYR